VSLALRSGIPMNDVVNQLRGISCDRAVGIGPSKVLSMPDAIGQVLQQHLSEKEGIQEELGLGGAVAPRASATPVTPPAGTTRPEAAHADYYDPGDAFIGTCPECSSDLMFAEGCVKCLTCGYSECG
ncbi:MAG: response regulator SirA, partial [Gemmatimonadota bacterium]